MSIAEDALLHYLELADDPNWNFSGASPTTLRDIEKRIEDLGEHALWVRDSTGNVVAHVAVSVTDGIGQLEVAVAKKWRRNAIGSALVRAGEDIARANGARAMYQVGVKETNDASIALCLTNGYKLAPQSGRDGNFEWSAGDGYLVFSKDLEV